MDAEDRNGKQAAPNSAGILAFIIGFVIASNLMSIVTSAVIASIVLFADAPAEFERHYPELVESLQLGFIFSLRYPVTVRYFLEPDSSGDGCCISGYSLGRVA